MGNVSEETVIIGLCGAACTGKTTLAERLQGLGSSVVMVAQGARELSQQTSFGPVWDVIDAIGALNLEAYLIGHWRLLEFLRRCSRPGSLIVTDTTPLDDLAYCDLLVGDENQAVIRFLTEQALRHLRSYTRIYFLPAGVFPFVTDEVRTRNTQGEHERIIQELSIKYDIEMVRIETSSVEERVEEILVDIAGLR